MMMVIPVYQVTYSTVFGGEPETFRVPQTQLEALLHVLIFNGVKHFEVEAEKNTTPEPSA